MKINEFHHNNINLKKIKNDIKFNIVMFQIGEFYNKEKLYDYCIAAVKKEFINDNIMVFHSLEEIEKKYNIPHNEYYNSFGKNPKRIELLLNYVRLYLTKYIDNMLYLDLDIIPQVGFREELINNINNNSTDINFFDKGLGMFYSEEKNNPTANLLIKNISLPGNVFNDNINTCTMFSSDYELRAKSKLYDPKVLKDLPKKYIHFIGLYQTIKWIKNNNIEVLTTKLKKNVIDKLTVDCIFTMKSMHPEKCFFFIIEEDDKYIGRVLMYDIIDEQFTDVSKNVETKKRLEKLFFKGGQESIIFSKNVYALIENMMSSL